jgi:hypothetical protein
MVALGPRAPVGGEMAKAPKVPENRSGRYDSPLSARELWIRRIWLSRLFCAYAASGDARQWPLARWCFLPDKKHGPRGFDLVIGDLPCRISPARY